jgi:hypothetical protein
MTSGKWAWRKFLLHCYSEAKASQINLPSGAFILTAPAQAVTLTNVEEPTHQVTLSITGTITRTMLPNGQLESIMNGRNIFFDDDPDVGFLLLIGHWRAITDASNTILEDLEGTGQRIELCPLLE